MEQCDADLREGEHLVQPYVMLGSSVGSTHKRKRLALRALVVTKMKGGLKWRFHDGPERAVAAGEQYPNYIDLQLHVCRTVFADGGAPKANAPATCTLSFMPGYVPGNKVTGI